MMNFTYWQGVGEITIVDPYQVTVRDLGKNFFVDQESIGKSRAETTARLLNEMNDLIQVHSVSEVCDRYFSVSNNSRTQYSC